MAASSASAAADGSPELAGGASGNSGYHLPDDPVVDFWRQPGIAGGECAALRDQGCAHFKEGRFADACECFDAAVRVKPECGPFLWQRGIARYYAGDFSGAAAQFATGRAVNADDTEELIWELLSLYGLLRAESPEAAAVASDETASRLEVARTLLRDVEEPRPALRVVQRLFDGRMAAAALRQLLLSGASGDLLPCEDAGSEALEDLSSQDLFYLWFYLALFDGEVEGRPEEAAEGLRRALGAQMAGEDFMRHVARIHAQTRQ
mmetsp:Transcript_21468/g.54834  ORF Transcript_21468/g.54834 Transcript_21468/m.54834 type:complete len:264 (-) Transcript_21468:54-845(-)